MLENRAFDHMLGFSMVSGRDAQSGQPTQLNGLTGESNVFNGATYTKGRRHGDAGATRGKLASYAL
jgi:phospholipase C